MNLRVSTIQLTIRYDADNDSGKNGDPPHLWNWPLLLNEPDLTQVDTQGPGLLSAQLIHDIPATDLVGGDISTPKLETKGDM